jgi:hypothetical protein
MIQPAASAIHLPFEGNVNDAWSNGYHGTLGGTAAIETGGHRGSALRLNGADGDTCLLADNALTQLGANSFLMAFWLRVNGVGGTNIPDFVSNRNLGAAGTVAGFAFGHAGSSADGRFTPVLDAGDGNHTSRGVDGFYAIGTRIHVAIIRYSDEHLPYLFRNGVQVAFDAGTESGSMIGKSVAASARPRIGGRPNATDRVADCQIDEFVIALGKYPLSAPRRVMLGLNPWRIGA